MLTIGLARDGAVTVASERGVHLKAWAITVTGAKPAANKLRGGLRAARRTRAAPIATLLPTASLAAPSPDGAGLPLAVLDAAMHTAGLLAGASAATRVPAAVGVFSVRARGAARAASAALRRRPCPAHGAWNVSFGLNGATGRGLVASLGGVVLAPVARGSGVDLSRAAVAWQVVEPGLAVTQTRRPAHPVHACCVAVAGLLQKRKAVGASSSSSPSTRAALCALAQAVAVETGVVSADDAVADAASTSTAPRVAVAAALAVAPRAAPLSLSRPTLIIPGGTGAVGRAVADWGGVSGVTSAVVVWGRKNAPSAPPRSQRATFVRADVSCAADVVDALAATPQLSPHVSLFNAGGVLADGVVASVRPAALRATAALKHAATVRITRTLAATPAAYLLCSSVASLLGSPGQAAYGAANGALDGVAQTLASRGTPARAVQWGA